MIIDVAACEVNPADMFKINDDNVAGTEYYTNNSDIIKVMYSKYGTERVFQTKVYVIDYEDRMLRDYLSLRIRMIGGSAVIVRDGIDASDAILLRLQIEGVVKGWMRYENKYYIREA